jgi:hypothetical protein
LDFGFWEGFVSDFGGLGGRERPKLRIKPGYEHVRRGRAKGTVGPPEMPVHSMANARVVDIECFNRMRDRGEGPLKIARWLGVSRGSALMLLAGQHWQQDPVRIAKFNEYRGTSIPVEGVELGFVTPDLVTQYGGASGKRKVARTPGEQAMVDIVKRSGISGVQAEEVASTLDLMAGSAEMPAERLDTTYFLEAVERKLALALASLTSVKIADATVGDLQKLISMFVEKRALLRGEPTQIVSHRQRVEIDKVLPMLVEAAKRRGLNLIDVTPRKEAADGS